MSNDQPDSGKAGLTVSEEEVRATEQLLRLLEKTHKTLRLYQTDNEVCRRLERELATATTQHLERWGECELNVAEHCLSLAEEVVYEAPDRTDSLAFLFYRDGIRKLDLLPGLEQDELHAFLTSLNQVSIASNDTDDLVTMFWEQDFQHIRYFAVEELSQERTGPSLEEQLASSTVDKEAGAERVSLDDLKRPVVFLPVEECLLAEHDIEALHLELSAEEERDERRTIVDLAAELALLDASAEERQAIRDSLVATIERTLEEDGLTAVETLVGRLVTLRDEVFAGEAIVAELCAGTVAQLSSKSRVSKALERLQREDDDTPEHLVAAYLQRLDSGAVPTLVSWVGRLPRAEHRRAVAEAVAGAGEFGTEVLRHHIRAAGVPHQNLLAEILHIVRRRGPGGGMPVVRELLTLSDADVRRQAAMTLGPYQEGDIGETWVELLSDDDWEVRSLALTALVRGGRPELAQHIADNTMVPGFVERSLEEKRRTFAAVARLSGEQCLPWLVEILQRPYRRHFLPRGEREVITAVVHAIAQVRSSEAPRILEELASSADRPVRAACRDALREMGHAG